MADKDTLWTTLISGIAVGVVCAALLWVPGVHDLEQEVRLRWLFKLRGPVQPPDEVVIDYQRLPGAGQTSGPGPCSLICADPVATTSGGDPYFARQWHLDNPGTPGKKHADINALKAWQITRGAPAITIAILDDLVDTSHEDLQGKIEAPWNAFTLDGSSVNLVLRDSDVHGTAAAGLAASATNNGIGVAGVAAEVKIMPVRAHDPTFPHYTVAAGIRHAADSAQVLSMSWTLGWASTYPTGIPIIEAAIEYAAVEKGRVLVFAAGNDQGVQASYPASRTSVFPIISVSATDQWDQLKKIPSALPSNPCEWGTSVGADTVAAPGVNLPTIDRMDNAGYCTSGAQSNYTKFNGTSAATPVVAGTAALMLSADSSLTPLQVRTTLQQTAEHPHPTARPNDTGPSGWGPGWGRIEACRALQGTDCERSSGSDSDFKTMILMATVGVAVFGFILALLARRS